MNKILSKQQPVNTSEVLPLNLQGRLLVTRREAMTMLGIKNRETIIGLELAGVLHPIRLTERSHVRYALSDVQEATKRHQSCKQTGALKSWEKNELRDLGIAI